MAFFVLIALVQYFVPLLLVEAVGILIAVFATRRSLRLARR